MNHFRFVHASDLHLDTPFIGVGRVDPDIAAALRDASLEAWDALVNLTVEERADFLVLVGDIYDGADRGVRAQLRFLHGIERLASRGITGFIVYGNHDPLDGWSAIRRWPSNVTIFGSDGIETVPVERRGERIAYVQGVSYPRRDVAENLALRFRRTSDVGFHIGLLHCNVGRPAHANYSPCTVGDLRNAAMDYWALGHIHKRETLSEGRPWIVYPGNLQGRSLKSSEQGAKGAVVVDVEDDRVAGLRFAPLDRVRSEVREINISDIVDIPELERRLATLVDELREQGEGRGLLLRVRLSGRGALHADLGRYGRLLELLSAMRASERGREPFVWWEGLADETRPTLDLETIASRKDFSAEVLAARDALLADSVQRRALIDGQFKLVERSGVQRWALDPDEEEETELIEEATALALDLLEEPRQ